MSQPSGLANLPNEVLCVILSKLDPVFVTHALLACTCKRLLASVISFLRPRIKTIHAPWVKCRIICLGDSTYYNEDLPDGFLTEAEKLEAATIPHGIPDAYPPGYFHYADKHYADTFVKFGPEMSPWDEHFGARECIKERTVDPSTCAQDVAIFTALHHTALTGGYGKGRPVLFNLTKGEYVREDGLNKTTRNWYGENAGLMQALLARVCWSPSRDCAMWLEDWLARELTQGSWAGDRFYITTIEEAPPLAPTGEPWKDVTEEVETFLWHVWRHAEMYDPLCGEEFKGIPGGDPSTAAKREAEEDAKMAALEAKWEAQKAAEKAAAAAKV